MIFTCFVCELDDDNRQDEVVDKTMALGGISVPSNTSANKKKEKTSVLCFAVYLLQSNQYKNK